MMDLHRTFDALMLMAAFGNQIVALEWFDRAAFIADVSPALDNITRGDRSNLRLYRYENAKPWSKANCYVARPSGPRYACDPGIAIVEIAEFRALEARARRQNRYVHEVLEAA